MITPTAITINFIVYFSPLTGSINPTMSTFFTRSHVNRPFTINGWLAAPPFITIN